MCTRFPFLYFVNPSFFANKQKQPIKINTQITSTTKQTNKQTKINISITIVLKNLQVKRDAVNALLPLPVHVKRGSVGRIELQVPVSQPTLIQRFVIFVIDSYFVCFRRIAVVATGLKAHSGACVGALCAACAVDCVQFAVQCG